MVPLLVSPDSGTEVTQNNVAELLGQLKPSRGKYWGAVDKFTRRGILLLSLGKRFQDSLVHYLY